MAPILALAQTHTAAVLTAVAATATMSNATNAVTNGTSTVRNATIITSSTTMSAVYANPTCDADYIVDQCLALTTITQENCDISDFACQCTSYQAIDT